MSSSVYSPRTIALHLAQSQNCEAFYTFDDRFIKRSSGLADNNVKRPKKIDDLNG